jgi:hypothetical protein
VTVVHLGDSGIVLGEVDTFGVDWGGTGDELPWSPSPSPRSVTGENATDHGIWDATEFYGPRVYALEGEALVPRGSDALLHQAEQRLKAAIGLKPFLLRVVEPGFDRQAYFRRDSPVSWKEITPQWALFSVSIIAPDPRAYSTQVRTASTGFPATAGGLSLPTVLPFALDAVATSGEMNLLNAGNETAWPTYRIDPSGTAPVVDPVIVDAATGRAMRFKITINPGEWLTVDPRNHRVLGNGDPQASRRSTFHGDWFGIGPSTSTTVRYTGASGVGSTLSATWRDTDI